jgi:hypothetical protein
MENGSTVYGMRSQWLKSDDPIYPCRRIKLRNRASCFLRVTTQILRTTKFDFAKTVQTCRSLEPKWRLYCFRSYGRDAEHAVGGKVGPTLRLCRLSGSAEGLCLYGAARTIADRDARAEGAAAFCRLAERRHQSACFAGLGVVIGLLEPTDKARREACRRLSEQAARECGEAAIAEVAPNGRGAWG